MSVTIKSLGIDGSYKKEELFLLADGDDKVAVRQMEGGNVGWACLCGYMCTTSDEQYNFLLKEGFEKAVNHDFKLKNTPKEGGEIEKFLAGVPGEANWTLSKYRSKKESAESLGKTINSLRRRIEEMQTELVKRINEEAEVKQNLGVEPEVKETWLKDLAE